MYDRRNIERFKRIEKRNGAGKLVDKTQRLSNIILKYEMKLQENKNKFTTGELVEATNKILNDD